MGKKEKRFLIFFIILCIALPFSMVRNTLEIASHVLPLWGFYGYVGFWSYTGKPIWQAFLATYGITSLGIIAVYFGTGIIQYTITKIRNRFGFKKYQKKKIVKEKKHRFAKWLAKGNVWVILFVLVFPFPYTDPAATIAMKMKGVKYGLWYLLLLNLPHMFFIVWLFYKGVKLFTF